MIRELIIDISGLLALALIGLGVYMQFGMPTACIAMGVIILAGVARVVRNSSGGRPNADADDIRR